MAKSISLSFDMNDLYLIDNANKAKKFSLSDNGVDISLDATSGELQVKASTNPSPGSDGVIKGKDGNQWTFEYCEDLKRLDFIGVQDILGNKTAVVNSFDLDNGGIVNVRLLGNSIVVSS